MTNYTASYRVELEDQYGRHIATFTETGGKALDQKNAETLAEILRAGAGEHKVKVSAAPPSRRQVWDIVLGLVAGQPVPDEVDVGAWNTFEIRVENNDRAAVAAWGAALGIAATAVVGKPSYGVTRCTVEGQPASVPGWTAVVYCVVEAQAPARVHGAGFDSPDTSTAEYTAWKAARETAPAEKAAEPVAVVATPAVVAKRAKREQVTA